MIKIVCATCGLEKNIRPEKKREYNFCSQACRVLSPYPVSRYSGSYLVSLMHRNCTPTQWNPNEELFTDAVLDV